MTRRFNGFIWIGLGISLLLALFLSPHASTAPDGLEKVAEMGGFAEKGKSWQFWKYAPLPDYAIPWIRNKKVSTALSGLIGTLAIFFIAFGIGRLIKNIPPMKMMLFLIFSSFIFFPPTFAHAARPLTTEDAYTVEKGAFQLETGFDFARQDNYDKEYAPSMTLTYGLFERMDMGVGIKYLFINPADGKNENGFGDTELKIKYRLIDQKGWIPFFSIAGKLKIPTANESKGLGSGKTDFNINTIYTWDFKKRFQLYVNLGYTFIGEKKVNNEFNYSIASQFVLSEKWALVGEISGWNNFNGRHNDDPLAGLLGIQYAIKDTLVWDAGAAIGMNRAAPDFRVTTGLTILFKF